jgi:hypothetical protein
MSVFSDVGPYSYVDTDRRFRDAYCLYYQVKHRDDEGSKHLWSVGFYEAQHPKGQSSSGTFLIILISVRTRYLARNSLTFMRPDSSLPYSQQPTTNQYVNKPGDFTPSRLTSLRSSHECVCLLYGLFLQHFGPKVRMSACIVCTMRAICPSHLS